jgi:hypothetical protein
MGFVEYGGFAAEGLVLRDEKLEVFGDFLEATTEILTLRVRMTGVGGARMTDCRGVRMTAWWAKPTMHDPRCD